MRGKTQRIERNADGTNAIGSEVHADTLGFVLGEHGDVLLFADAESDQRI